MGYFPQLRLQRLRRNETIRGLIRENQIDVNKLVLPLFIKHGSGVKQPIMAMPGHCQLSIDQLPLELEEIKSLGIKSILLFGIPAEKNPTGKDAYDDHGVIQQALAVIKQLAPQLLVISDICFCEYTDHGHCGFIPPESLQTKVLQTSNGDVHVDNDATLALLVKQTLSHVKAGTDIIAPSGNMDGMVQALRQALDQANYHHIPILSYAVKYASSLYNPFREAAEGAPQFGDRRTYQMDCANANEALREVELDIQEGADMIMVKPAHAYLDIIYRVKKANPHIPLCAYHTSGEYAMIKAAAMNGWINEKQTVIEILTAIRRAGADFIMTYYAKDIAKWF